jgi:DNA-binding GntR family transcriptional regulator
MAIEEKVASKKAWEDAYETIEELILSAQLTPGEAVTEIALSERLGISRTPIREAMKKLEEKGLIISTNGRKRIYMLTISEMEEVFDLKICLEGQVARWATERGSEEEFDELGIIMAEMRLFVEKASGLPEHEQQELNQWLEIDKRLHTLLFQMAKTPKANNIIQNLNRQWHRLKVGVLTLEGRMQRTVTEHEKFVKAIHNRSANEAEQAMKEHLENIKRELVKLMRMFQFPT